MSRAPEFQIFSTFFGASSGGAFTTGGHGLPGSVGRLPPGSGSRKRSRSASPPFGLRSLTLFRGLDASTTRWFELAATASEVRSIASQHITESRPRSATTVRQDGPSFKLARNARGGDPFRALPFRALPQKFRYVSEQWPTDASCRLD
jgi:hypothetical protein